MLSVLFGTTVAGLAREITRLQQKKEGLITKAGLMIEHRSAAIAAMTQEIDQIADLRRNIA